MSKKEKNEMCGYTEVIGGHEFYCTLKYHGSEFDKNGQRRPERNSRGGYAKWMRHWLRRSNPMRG